MKTFTIIKVGYSSGIYGCSSEYFQAVIIKDGELSGLPFQGLYGTQERIAAELKTKGYEQKHIQSGTYGKITGKDKNFALYEEQAIEQIKADY
jgi:hypothetical protein